MTSSYLEGGKSLEGVTAASINIVDNDSSFHYSSESLIDVQEPHQLIFRRLGLCSQDLARRMIQAKSDLQQVWRITTLDASRNQITSIPSIVQQFSHLTLLNLSCNNLSVIPEAILGLHQLQQLYLSENQIHTIHEAMPMYLTELMVLNLDSNRIKVLPESIGQWKTLCEFRLGSEYGGNLIESLPDSVSDMQALVDLDLSFNHLQNVGKLQGLRKLKHLNLSHNRIKYLPMFDDCSQLSTLDISDNLIQAIPFAAANNVLRLMTYCQLQLLNLSNNRLDVIPTEILDQTQTQIIIQGNPLTSSYQQPESNIRDMIQTAIPMTDYHRHVAETLPMEDEDTIQHAEQADDNRDRKHQGTYLLHSLREIALRAIVLEGDQLLPSDVPEHLTEEIRENLQLCRQCQSPFLFEWVSTAQFQFYQAHRSVARQIRFCGTVCLLAYRETLQQKALAAQGEVYLRQQQQEALAYIAQHGHILEPGSFEWVMAASLAATTQEEQADLLANVAMMMM